MARSPHEHIKQVVDCLPFSVDDVDAVNETFQRWRQTGSERDERCISMWTYCFTLRYFLAKSAQGNLRNASDLDALVDKAYTKILDNRDSVRNAARYASWVSVVCKNVFLNYSRQDRREQSIDEDGGPTLTTEPSTSSYDAGFVTRLLETCIEELPEYLQETAHLYFIEGYTYEEISEEIDKPVPTVRTYKHKVVRRFRKNSKIAELLERSTRE